MAYWQNCLKIYIFANTIEYYVAWLKPDKDEFGGEVADDKGDEVSHCSDGDCQASMLHHLEIRKSQHKIHHLRSSNQPHPLINGQAGFLL